MKYLIGIDVGTSGTKTALFAEDGKLMASHTAEYPLYQPKNGYAEQEPTDWWNATCEGLKKVIEKSGIDKNDVAGIGLSGQMHGLVMLDENGNVLRKSIIWCDQRTAKECEEITERCGLDMLMSITASPALTGFTASKILWVRNNEPEIYAKCKHILLPKDYILYMLTGVFATDVSDASGMQLLDIAKRDWSKEILEKLEIPYEWLGKVYESCEVSGNVSDAGSAACGIPAGVPVVGGAGDNAAAAVGCGVVRDGRAFTTIGTSGVVFAHTSKMSVDPNGRCHTFCAAVPGAWHVMGVTQAAGLSLKWYKDNFCDTEIAEADAAGKNVYALLDEKAAGIPIGCDRLLYLPYLMGERTPHLDPNARGVFFGLSAMHTRAHLLRAVMEGVTYSLRDCLSIFGGLGVKVDSMMACGGGGSSKLWRQMLADVFGCTVKQCVSNEGGALGAAILAGVGAGLYPSVEEACDKIISVKGEQPCDAERSAQYDKFYDIYTNLYANLKASCAKLAQL